MRKTKLILVDGMTGSGKSVTAHFLARQLAGNGLTARWYHEEEPDHPLLYREPMELASLPERERKERYMASYPDQWSAFAASLRDQPGTAIVECYLFQSSLIGLVRMEYPRERIKAFARSLVDRVRELDPVIISFYQEDVPGALRLNWARRGKEWEDWYVGRMAKMDYATRRGLSGEDAAFMIWEEWMSTTREVLGEFGLPCLAIETSAQDWPAYRRRILDFLGLRPVPEQAYRQADARFAGRYHGKEGDDEITYTVRHGPEGLRMDAFWPDLRLLPRSENVFDMEGFPFVFRFNLGPDGRPASLEVEEAAFAFEKGWKLEAVRE